MRIFAAGLLSIFMNFSAFATTELSFGMVSNFYEQETSPTTIMGEIWLECNQSVFKVIREDVANPDIDGIDIAIAFLVATDLENSCEEEGRVESASFGSTPVTGNYTIYAIGETTSTDGEDSEEEGNCDEDGNCDDGSSEAKK